MLHVEQYVPEFSQVWERYALYRLSVIHMERVSDWHIGQVCVQHFGLACQPNSTIKMDETK